MESLDVFLQGMHFFFDSIVFFLILTHYLRHFFLLSFLSFNHLLQLIFLLHKGLFHLSNVLLPFGYFLHESLLDLLLIN